MEVELSDVPFQLITLEAQAKKTRNFFAAAHVRFGQVLFFYLALGFAHMGSLLSSRDWLVTITGITLAMLFASDASLVDPNLALGLRHVAPGDTGNGAQSGRGDIGERAGV